jgi:hypothetical protein
MYFIKCNQNVTFFKLAHQLLSEKSKTTLIINTRDSYYTNEIPHPFCGFTFNLNQLHEEFFNPPKPTLK